MNPEATVCHGINAGIALATWADHRERRVLSFPE